MALFRHIAKVLHDNRGASSVEYGVILALIVLVMFVALRGVADETTSMWGNISTRSSNAISGQ